MLIKKAFTSKRIKDEYENITCILVYGNKTVVLRLSPEEIAEQYGVATPDGVTLMLMGKVDHAGAG